jgi:glyoxylase-like metal-dependent hydrolase (beta-lactamase superfamily II)
MFLLQKTPKSDPSSLSYLLGCGGKGKAIAVDIFPEDVSWFMEQAKIKEVEIMYIIDTHIHADHVSGGLKLAKESGGIYCLNELSQPDFSFNKLKDNEILTIGNVSVKIIHTPGHTNDSLCLLVSDNKRSSEPWFLLTGHTLFVGSVGRPDLLGQEQKMAEQLYNSIFNKLLTLPEHVEIYPGV